MDSKIATVESPSALPILLDSRNNNEKSSTEQRRPTRRNPEKRRQQNIQAQKKYREKLKKRLDQLETLTAECPEPFRVAAPGNGPRVAPTFQNSLLNSTTTEIQTYGRHNEASLKDDSPKSSVDFSDLNFLTTFPPKFSLDIALWDPTTLIDPSQISQSKETAFEPPHWIGYFVQCGCTKPHVQISSSHPKDYRDLKVQNIRPEEYPADPYLNTLRVESVCLTQAIFANCLHIGITQVMFCDDDTVSPFFRPNGSTTDDASGYDSIVKTMQSIFRTLKQDVRPIREQITTLHSPVIDVLPFPTFRKNLIQSGEAVDEDELYEDLLNGLICWGGAGIGKRDRDCSTGDVSTGTPWDSRSWEARTWFLQKYWVLLGGEDGELVQQSEWWRNMRGDEQGLWSEFLNPL